MNVVAEKTAQFIDDAIYGVPDLHVNLGGTRTVRTWFHGLGLLLSLPSTDKLVKVEDVKVKAAALMLLGDDPGVKIAMPDNSRDAVALLTHTEMDGPMDILTRYSVGMNILIRLSPPINEILRRAKDVLRKASVAQLVEQVQAAAAMIADPPWSADGVQLMIRLLNGVEDRAWMDAATNYQPDGGKRAELGQWTDEAQMPCPELRAWATRKVDGLYAPPLMEDDGTKRPGGSGYARSKESWAQGAVQQRRRAQTDAMVPGVREAGAFVDRAPTGAAVARTSRLGARRRSGAARGQG